MMLSILAFGLLFAFFAKKTFIYTGILFTLAGVCCKMLVMTRFYPKLQEDIAGFNATIAMFVIAGLLYIFIGGIVWHLNRGWKTT